MLTPRQRQILAAVVEDYVRFAEPVGSRTLSKHAGFQISSATIRNEMADLEELGFLDQPHASAGRIPSQKGYRFYVDHLSEGNTLEPDAIGSLRTLFEDRLNEMERVIQQTTNVLSQLTQHTAIVLGPQIHQEKIKHIQLIPLGHPGSAVVLLVTDTGHVENRQVQLGEDISPDEVVRLVNLLNHKLEGTPLSTMRSRLYREIANEMTKVLESYEGAIALLDDLSQMGQSTSERLYVSGATNVLAQPEFRDVEKARPLLEWLEQADWSAAANLLSLGNHQILVRIGQENDVALLRDCSVVSATFRVSGQPAGHIGIIGPTRMNYSRVIQILDYVTKGLSDVMTHRLRGS